MDLWFVVYRGFVAVWVGYSLWVVGFVWWWSQRWFVRLFLFLWFGCYVLVGAWLVVCVVGGFIRF